MKIPWEKVWTDDQSVQFRVPIKNREGQVVCNLYAQAWQAHPEDPYAFFTNDPGALCMAKLLVACQTSQDPMIRSILDGRA